MTDILNRVKKYINSQKTLKFIANIEIPLPEPNMEPNRKRKEDDEICSNKK